MVKGTKVTIKKDREWGEYIVKLWKGGKVVADYHTLGITAGDKEDAEATAKSMRKSAGLEGAPSSLDRWVTSRHAR